MELKNPGARTAAGGPRRVLGSWGLAGLLAAGGLVLGGLVGPVAADNEKPLRFAMVRSTAAAGANCLPNASGQVKITPQGPVERMDVQVRGLPPNTEFDF